MSFKTATSAIGKRALTITAGVLFSGLAVWGQNTLTVNSITAFPDTTDNQVTISATSDVAIHSLSLSLTYPTNLVFAGSSGTYPAGGGVDLTGTILQTVSPLGVPEFFHVDADVPGQLIIGIIIDLDPLPPTSAIPASVTEQPLLHLLFDVSALTAPGNYPITLVDGLGTPPISNTFSSAGTSYFPTLTSGTVMVENPNFFMFDDLSIPNTVPVIATVRVSHDLAMQGFQTVVSWDKTKLSYTSVTGIGTNADQLLINPNLSAPGAEPYEGLVNSPSCGVAPTPSNSNPCGGFVEVKFEPNAAGPNRDLLTVAVVFDFLPPFVGPPGMLLPAGTDQSILRYRFQPLAGATNGSSTQLRFENGMGSPPQFNFVILDGGESVSPLVTHGTISFDNSVIVFRRGNVNNDSDVNIADAIFILGYLFSNGPTPSCLDASDPNDDGLIDISDAIFMVGYLFGNQQQPLPPFPACGVDPTDEGLLNCVSYTGGC